MDRGMVVHGGSSMLLEDILKSLADTIMQLKQNQETTISHMQSLAIWLSQLANSVRKLDAQYGKLPYQPVSNLRNVSAISTACTFKSPLSPTPEPVEKSSVQKIASNFPKKRGVRFNPLFIQIHMFLLLFSLKGQLRLSHLAPHET